MSLRTTTRKGDKLTTAKPYDIAIIGGGILGIATAMQTAAKHPRLRIAVFEKEPRIAAHQTGHNSGVIHSGIYYAPGSLKAKNCVGGAEALKRFADENGIKYELCGKVIIATTEEELPRLQELHRRGVANGVQGLEVIDRSRINEIEPNAAGIRGLYSPNTGIIDFTEVTRAYAAKFEQTGGEIKLDTRVEDIIERAGGVILQTSQGEIQASHLINCAGLYADVIAKMMGAAEDLRIVPFRGEYYELRPEAHSLIRGLIYPVPNPEFPFLGVHFTKRVNGTMEAGPNAVLAFAREGYTKTTFDPRESFDALGYGGFWTMARKYWKTGLHEIYRSFSKQAFTKALQRLVPSIREEDLIGGGSGVRAQAVASDGKLLDDFRIVESANAIHVLNAPSPGATASLAISAGILTMAETAFSLNQ
ncbi:MAG: L-2-hydroxyglutarate oxidase [Dehalococcoidia bacterium]|nr:L-2-hydroxyglutarate oxidase [Dehalococcoidia bacterium]